MANNSAPTHLFGGSVGLIPNTYPDNTLVDATFGGFRQASLYSNTAYVANTTVQLTAESPRNLIFNGTVAATFTLTLNYPAASAVMVGNSYRVIVCQGFVGDVAITTSGGTQIDVVTATSSIRCVFTVDYIATSANTYAAVVTQVAAT